MARTTMSMERVTVRDDRKKRRSDLSELVAVDGRYVAECETIRPEPWRRPNVSFMGDQALPGIDDREMDGDDGRYGWAIGE